MDSLPLELLSTLLFSLGPYAPVLRHVCQRWRDILATYEGPILELRALANSGHLSLLDWVAGLRQGVFSPKVAQRIMSGAAKNGHNAIVCLAKEWGTTDYDQLMAYAAKGGHEAIVRLAKSWGAINFNWAMAWAALGGHEAT